MGTIVSEDVLNAAGGAQAASFHWTSAVDSRGCMAAFAASSAAPPPTTGSAPTTTPVPDTSSPPPTGTVTPALAPVSPPKPPSQILDLSDWYLTLPVGSDTAAMVMQPAVIRTEARTSTPMPPMTESS